MAAVPLPEFTTTSNILFHTDFHALAFHPNYDGLSNQTLFNTNDGGVYRTDNARTQAESLTCAQPFYNLTGTAVNNGLQVNQFYHGAVTAGGGLLLGGTQDTCTLLGSAASSSQWNTVLGGDGGMSVFDPLDPNTIYYEYHGLGFSRTTDGGNTYVAAITGIGEPASDFPFVTYFVLDPQNSQTLYIGGNQLWRSADGAETWAAASPNTGAAITAIAVNPADSNQVLYGDVNGVIYNGSLSASSWNSSQPRSGYVSRIVFDQQHAGLIYATYATFRTEAADRQGYVSTDGGNTWSALGASSLPDIPVHVLLVDPDVPSTLYVATDIGIFVSFDSGDTWANDSSFPSVITESLQIDRNGAAKYLYAFTYGRGAWRVSLTQDAVECTYSVSPPSFSMDGSSGKLYAVHVDTAPGCAWAASAAPSLPYVRIQSPAGGNGPGTLYFMVGANYSGAVRSLQLSVQDQTVSIQQTTLNVATQAFDELSGAAAISLPYYRAGGFNLLTVNPRDPVHSCTGSADLSTGWFTYTASASQRIDVSAGGSSPMALTVYHMQNSTLAGEIGCATNSSNVAVNPSVQFDAVAGSRYAIEISGVGRPLSSSARVTLTGRVLPTVVVSPVATNLTPGQSMQFTATVTGIPNTAARWTAQYGRIDTNGNYTAPANVPADTITARSLADANASATSSIALQIQP